MTRQRIVYAPDEQPDVEVLVEDAWLPGKLRMQTQDDGGVWWFNVQWRPAGEATRRLDTFDEAHVRRHKVDRCAGRE